MSAEEIVRQALAVCAPLRYPRGGRLPIRASRLEGWIPEDDGEARALLKQLDERGLAINARWTPGAKQEESLRQALRLGRLQKELGLGIGVNATACMHYFFNGDPRTFHIADDGTPFFDDSFAPRRKMGCPFALKFRYPEIKAQLEYFLRAYKEAGLDIEFIYVDWEIDGPIEWNDAWAHSKRCVRCRENIPHIEDFREFQRALRTIRCEIQREVYAKTVKQYFPNALVGNYAVYPHDGYRYWYDWFERLPEGAPYKADQRAKYREWFDEFPLTGYTFAMPVVYTWYPTWGWYDFDVGDYRWFYNMLLVATNVCKSTPADIPIISWVHWHTTAPREDLPLPDLKQFSEEKYQELLWHMLLRGCDAFIMWCRPEETAKELQLVQEVYAASLEFKEFLDRGQPVLFDVPSRPGPVVSALKLGDRLLVRRTDFTDDAQPVLCAIAGKEVQIPRAEGRCQLLTLPGG